MPVLAYYGVASLRYSLFVMNFVKKPQLHKYFVVLFHMIMFMNVKRKYC